MSAKLLFRTTIFLLFAFIIVACNSSKSDKNNTLIIFHAGSLSVPVKQISKAFQKENPNIQILAEAAGSIACARKITDLERPCDLLLSADYAVIDKFLIPDHADWNIKFASNEMVIAYTDQSIMAKQINENNWMDILQAEDVKYGRSNPNFDPCGYRTALCLSLSEKFHQLPNLSKNILAKDHRFIRPKETDLIALLETQTIDYIFIYRSVAVQHHLNFLPLPDSVNLKNPELSDWYKSASVEINGKTPGQKITQHGEAMIYGLTIPTDAPHKDNAIKFLTFFLEAQKGMKIMEQNGQPSLVPSPTESWNLIPNPLQKFAFPHN